MRNESALTYNWLVESLGLESDESSITVKTWNRIRNQMREVTQGAAASQMWVSDFWLCKGAQQQLAFCAKWKPPDRLDEWQIGDELIRNPNLTNHQSFLKLLSDSRGFAYFNENRSLFEFDLLDKESKVGNTQMHQAQYIRAFLFIAIGPLLSSMVLTPNENNENSAFILSDTLRRLSIPRRYKKPLWGNLFSEGDLEILYNCRQSPTGYLHLSRLQVGQGDEWMIHWQWLSATVSFKDALAAVQLAARLFRTSMVLVQGLLFGLNMNDNNLQELTIAVFRRWLLTLKAMTWLENALQKKWYMVRAQDLSCFAFNAIKPEWPRRLVSVSHRSFESKPLLQQTKAWNSPLFAIDATYVPSWETNTGMIWGLFALTPVVTIINSPGYLKSEWCQRELELLGFLKEQSDFHPYRQFEVMRQEEVTIFNQIHDYWFSKHTIQGYKAETSVLHNFPPLCNVYVPTACEEWTLSMLRSASLLRLMQAVLNDADGVNRVSQFLLRNDSVPPFPCYTEQPGGWAVYSKVFRALSSEFKETNSLHIWKPDEVSVLNPDELQKLYNRMPDFSSGNSSFEDVLVALEWMHTLLPMLEDSSAGDMILIDLRGISKEIWETHPKLSLARGIASLRQPPKPVWYLQNAGQEVEKWGMLGGDLPIFTQHTDNQYKWMLETYLPPEWPAWYADRCGLEMSTELNQRCKDTRAT